jgi:hypothetical protein
VSNGSCFCGLAEEGNAYCGSLQGDKEYEEFIDAFADVAEINNACHSSISYSNRCPQIKNSKEAKALVSSFYRYFYRHKLVNVPQCVMDVYFPGVSEGFEGSGGSAGDSESDSSDSSEGSLGTVGIIVVVVVIVGILIIGVIIYFIVRK